MADSGQNSVIAVDQATGRKTTIRSSLNWPFGLARLANGDLLVSNRGDGKLTEISTQGSLVATYDTGLGANALRGLTMTSKNVLYVLNDRNQTIYQVTLSAAPAAQVTTVDAASFRSTRVAPGSIAVAFGAGFSTDSAAAASSLLPLTLAGATVTISTSAGTVLNAPLYSVGPKQVNLLVPEGAAFGPGVITISGADGARMTGPLDIQAVGPGLFTANATGKGVPAANLLRIRADLSQSVEAVAQLDASNTSVPLPINLGPATDQLFLILYGTGIHGRSALSAVGATIGGIAAEVLFAGSQGAFQGLDQVNVRIPRAVAGSGEVDLALTVDGQTANPVRLSFQ